MKTSDQSSLIGAARSSATYVARNNQVLRGSLDGATVRYQPIEEDIDDKLEIEYQRKIIGLEAPDLNLMRIALNYQTAKTQKGTAKSEVEQFIRTLGNSKASADLAKKILQKFLRDEPLPRPGKSLMDLANFQSALQRINAALEGTDEEFVAWMSPLKYEVHDLMSFAQKLQNAGDDKTQIHSLLEDFSELPDDKEEVAKEFATTRFDLSKLKRKLRDVQNLPVLDDHAKTSIKEKIQDEISELQAIHGSHLQGLKNLLDKAGGMANRELAESYDTLLHSPTTGFTSTAEALLAKHSDNVLIETVIPLFEKTLSHELQLSDELRSVDKERLFATLSDIQNMRILKTIIEKTNIFLSSFGRMYGIFSK